MTNRLRAARLGPDNCFQLVISLPQTGRAASGFPPACRQTGAKGRRCAPPRSPHSPGKVVPGRCAVLNSLHPAWSRRQHHSAWRSEDARAPVCGALLDDPLGTDQERHAAAITDAEADQMFASSSRSLWEIGDDPGESFERCQSADISNSDVVNQRVRVAIQIE